MENKIRMNFDLGTVFSHLMIQYCRASSVSEIQRVIFAALRFHVVNDSSARRGDARVLLQFNQNVLSSLVLCTFERLDSYFEKLLCMLNMTHQKCLVTVAERKILHLITSEIQINSTNLMKCSSIITSKCIFAFRHIEKSSELTQKHE